MSESALARERERACTGMLFLDTMLILSITRIDELMPMWGLYPAGGSCVGCFQGPPGVPADHQLGGCSCDEFFNGCCICCGFGQVMLFNGESRDASMCNAGLLYFFPYIGDCLGMMVSLLCGIIIGSRCIRYSTPTNLCLIVYNLQWTFPFLKTGCALFAQLRCSLCQVHYPLRQRLESKLVNGTTVGGVATCPPFDACCVSAWTLVVVLQCCHVSTTTPSHSQDCSTLLQMFWFPTCLMCQELRAIRGAKYNSETTELTKLK